MAKLWMSKETKKQGTGNKARNGAGLSKGQQEPTHFSLQENLFMWYSAVSGIESNQTAVKQGQATLSSWLKH